MKVCQNRDASFALVIPALNEEEAIRATLERGLAARSHILMHTPVSEMWVVFVNDGSTDGTQAIADSFPEVVKIHFQRNKGYGAAIMAGFQATGAALVGFMDADGTCDPRFCVDLINHLLETNSDIAVGSRMTAESEMPMIRRLGNWIFARLIGAVSGCKLTDSASGMRVLRRSCLRQLHPLPDGLHFTPAMTCLALLDPRLKISEVPMPYKERTGESKLRVFNDGLRFLGIILFTAALFNPIKSLALLGFLFCIFGAGLSYCARLNGAAETVLFSYTAAFGVVFLQAVFVGFLCHQMLHMLIGPWRMPGSVESLLKHFWTKQMVRAGIIILAVSLVIFAGTFLAPTGWRTPMWIVSAGLVLVSGWTALAGVILRVIWAAKERRIAEREGPAEGQNHESREIESGNRR